MTSFPAVGLDGGRAMRLLTTVRDEPEFGGGRRAAGSTCPIPPTPNHAMAKLSVLVVNWLTAMIAATLARRNQPRGCPPPELMTLETQAHRKMGMVLASTDRDGNAVCSRLNLRPQDNALSRRRSLRSSNTWPPRTLLLSAASSHQLNIRGLQRQQQMVQVLLQFLVGRVGRPSEPVLEAALVAFRVAGGLSGLGTERTRPPSRRLGRPLRLRRPRTSRLGQQPPWRRRHEANPPRA